MTTTGNTRTRPSMAELAKVSLYLGCVGFGGGMTVLAGIRRQSVEKNRWLTEREFANTATVAQMLPGGAAANALAAIGLRFQGYPGACAAYLGFILPGAIATTALSMVYVRFGSIPHAGRFLEGLNAAVVGVILAITLRMLRTSVYRLWQMGIATASLLLALVGGAGSGEVALIGIGGGLVWDLGVERAMLGRFKKRHRRPAPPVGSPEEGGILPRPGMSAQVAVDLPSSGNETARLAWTGLAGALAFPSLAVWLPLFLVMIRVGLGAYGGGFAIIPSLDAHMQANHWLSTRQFADGVAIAKLTPGPVLLLATFVGYVRGGVAGALVATIGVFAAPFLLVVVLSDWIARMRSRRWLRAALRGLTSAVVGLMTAAALTLGRTLPSLTDIAISAAVALTLMRFEKVNPVSLVLLSGILRGGLHWGWGY